VRELSNGAEAVGPHRESTPSAFEPFHYSQVIDPLPALIIGFNRPAEATEVAVSAVRQGFSPIYVAMDGPRPHVPSDQSLCLATREAVSAVVQPEARHTLFSEANEGCERFVPRAITWFFESEECGVILEDDCVPSESFHRFCRELLTKYESEPRVMMISGNNHLSAPPSRLDTYSFVRQGLIWGWATWRSSWDRYDHEMSDWAQLRRSAWLEDMCGGDAEAASRWRETFDYTIRGRRNTWDSRWVASMWAHQGLSVAPPINLVRNIGFDSTATHTAHAPTWYSSVRHGEMQFPLVHPAAIERDQSMERAIDSSLFGGPGSRSDRAKRKLLHVLLRVGLDRPASRLVTVMRSLLARVRGRA